MITKSKVGNVINEVLSLILRQILKAIFIKQYRECKMSQHAQIQLASREYKHASD